MEDEYWNSLSEKQQDSIMELCDGTFATAYDIVEGVLESENKNLSVIKT